MFFGGGFPFGGMGGMGGFEPEMPKGDTTKYYKVLGVDQNASAQEIRKAFRRKAVELHPDKGGDPEKFKELNTAYEVLSNEEKRKIYDKYGEDAVKDMGNSSGASVDPFSALFGGGRSREPRERRGDDVVHKLHVTLEELYSGNTRKLALTRKVLCGTCNGKGTRSGKSYECERCHGQGVEVIMRPLGPGMMQQIQRPCSTCSGTGSSVPPSDKCGQCNGNGLQPEKKVFEVHIEPGMKNGQKIIKHGEAGVSEPGIQPGDLVFVIAEKPNDTFKRAGWDLIVEKQISLKDALCGGTTWIKQLDGRVLRIKTQPGEVIKPDCWKRIEEEGMPVHGRPFTKGNMYIHFTVNFPDELDAETAAVLKKVLPGDSDQAMADVDMEHVEDIEKLLDVGIGNETMAAELRQRHQEQKASGGPAYESDSDEEGHGRGGAVRCAQQ